MTGSDYDIYIRLALALGIGVLVGLERGWRTRALPEGQRVAGVRTFTLIGLLGGLLGVASAFAGEAVIAVGVLGFLVLLAVAYYNLVQQTEDRGLTTEVAAVITLILGIVAVRGDMLMAMVAAVLVIAILAAKQPVHAWVKAIEHAEVNAAIKLLLMSVVMLPLLPNEGYGPGEFFNPYELWWVVVIIAGISFAAHAGIRMAGAQAGISLMGLLGGLASSTAVALNSARFAARAPAMARMLAGGVGLASAVMFLRAFVLVFVLNRDAALLLTWPLLSASACALVVGIVMLRSDKKKTTDTAAQLDLGPPADIQTALKFAAALIVIELAVHYGRIWMGAAGSIAAAALAGLVDVDAATISVARLGERAASGEVVGAVLAAVAVNTIAKFAYTVVIAGRVVVPSFALAFGVPLLVGAIVALGVFFVLQG